MGTGWRTAFCTAIARDREAAATDIHRTHNQKKRQQESQSESPTPLISCAKLGLFSSFSNPSTPRFSSQPPTTSSALRCRTTAVPEAQYNTPRALQCHIAEKKPSSSSSSKNSPRRRRKMGLYSNPSSPRSPFTVLKNTLRLSKSGCGVCLQSVKTGQGMAIYTAECSHSFHFPCIAQHIRKQGSLTCPVCLVAWKDVPLLSAHKSLTTKEATIVEKTITTTSMTATGAASNVPKSSYSVDGERIQSLMPIVRTRDNHSRSPSDDTSRSYTDDESLLSPTAGGARFNPIPEADEDDGDMEEFKGFFVNVTPSTPSTPTKKVAPYSEDRGLIHRNVEVKLLPEAAVVSVGRSQENFAVALRVKAPMLPPSAHGVTAAAPLLSPSHRAPIDLVAVLDIGGTMAGAKLQMMKRAMRLLISSLGCTDRLSIVAFADPPSQRLMPLRRMTKSGQLLARRIVDQLCCAQGKCVGEALRMAAKVLEDRREQNPVASIILLSDGQEGEVDKARNDGSSVNQQQRRGHASSTRFGHVEIPVHSLGGSGSSLVDSFAKKLGGFLSVVVQDLRVHLGFFSGSAPTEIVAVYSCNGRPTLLSCDSIRLGDLYAEEERELLVELRVPASAIGSRHVMSVRCVYKDPSSQEVVYGRERALLLPRPHAVRSSDPRNERMRNVFIVIRAIAESRRLVDHGEFGSAHQLLMSARALLARSSSASADEYVRRLEAELVEVHWMRRQQEEVMLMSQLRKVGGSGQVTAQCASMVDDNENGDALTPTSAWRAAERLAKVAVMKKSLNRASDLHGFENARF